MGDGVSMLYGWWGWVALWVVGLVCFMGGGVSVLYGWWG